MTKYKLRLPKFSTGKYKKGQYYCSIQFWNGRYVEYGGFNQWISRWTGINELEIGLRSDFYIGYDHIWYDWQYHSINLGFVFIGWMGRPLLDHLK